MKTKKQRFNIQAKNNVNTSQRRQLKEKLNLKTCNNSKICIDSTQVYRENGTNSPFQKMISKFQNRGLRALDLIDNSSDHQFSGNKIGRSINDRALDVDKTESIQNSGDNNSEGLSITTHQDVCSNISNMSALNSKPESVEDLSFSTNIKTSIHTWPQLGRLQVEIPNCESYINQNEVNIENDEEMEDFCEFSKSPKGLEPTLTNPEKLVPINLIQNILKLKGLKETENILTNFQTELFNIINNYQDLFFPQQTVENSIDIRFTYCLHLLNHIIGSNSTVKLNNEKIASALKSNTNMSEERSHPMRKNYLDQGLVRPKVLILLPFRSSAFNVVKIMADILYGEKSGFSKTNKTIEHLNRFIEEFADSTIPTRRECNKPEDYTKLFSGNVNDNFKFGICLKSKSLRLYTDFYSSDIIIASPLGLRSLIGAPGDPDRDFDFLNSIEILILDQADIFLAQNWDHTLHIINHLHLKPQQNRTEDYSRVRTWCLKGLSRYYRQTLLFTSHELPEFRALYENHCLNHRGKVHISNAILHGSIQNILIKIPQTFYRVNASNFHQSIDSRFNYFVNEILPKFRNFSSSHCMVYIPSYFDFVRLRNYFKSESISFVQICEYSKKEKIARARNIFFHSGSPFLLYSERFHFFRRPRIKGIRHLIIYQPPSWPYLYDDIINLMQDCNQNPQDGLENNMDITVLYTKYDLLRLSGIVGSENALKLARSRNSSHIFSNK